MWEARTEARIAAFRSTPAVKDAAGYGVWEPQKELKTGKIYWTNHDLQKTAWEPPKGGTAVVQQVVGHAQSREGERVRGGSKRRVRWG